jgi:hypothetical protein
VLGVGFGVRGAVEQKTGLSGGIQGDISLKQLRRGGKAVVSALSAYANEVPARVTARGADP